MAHKNDYLVIVPTNYSLGRTQLITLPGRSPLGVCMCLLQLPGDCRGARLGWLISASLVSNRANAQVLCMSTLVSQLLLYHSQAKIS